MVLSSASPRRGFNFALILSVIGVILGGFAVFMALDDPNEPGFSFRNPLGGRLKPYEKELETPAGTAKALLQMRKNNDFQAYEAYQARFHEKDVNEKFESFKVEKEEDFKREVPKDSKASPDVKVLFVTFKEEGKDVKTVMFMEQHADSKLWRETTVDLSKDNEKNKELRKKIDDHKQAK